MGTRYLTQREANTAFTVFGYTLPYQAIHLSSGLGAGNRPFTIPDPLQPGHYRIYIGPKVEWKTLVHELSHVWQGYNSPFAWSYIFDSLLHQAVSGTDAYKYTLGKGWGEYNVEQQASIVEDWFQRGRSTKDPAFRYIRDNVWKGITEIGFTSNEDFDHILK